MLLTAYVVFLLLAAAAYHWRRVRPPSLLRIAAGLVAFGAAVLGFKLVGLGSIFPVLLIVGGGTYVLGMVEYETAGAGTRRRVGFWICLLALAFPSTLTLLLPLTAVLVACLPVQEDRSGIRQAKPKAAQVGPRGFDFARVSRASNAR